MDARTDEQLLGEHLSGVAGAFDHLVGRYAGELYGFLMRYVGSASAADDLVQDTFVQVHVAGATFDPSRSFKPWLYTIAANKARDFMRSRGRRMELSLESSLTRGDGDGAGLGDVIEAAAERPGASLESMEREAAVRAVIERMPEHLRMILLMGYFQQLPYADIAEVLKIPIGTVKSRLHAAVQHFAEQWRTRGMKEVIEP